MKNSIRRIIELQKTGDFIAPSLINDLDLKESVELFVDDDFGGLSEGFMELKSNIELFSPEDLAWVDSCLVADPELSMESWVSLKEALIGSITTFADSYDENNAAGFDKNETHNGDKMEIDGEKVVINDLTDAACFRKQKIGEEEMGINDLTDAARFREQKIDEEEVAISDLTDAARFRELKNDIGDSHAEDDKEDEIQKEIELRESIFRVWNLREEQEEEEDELISELKRAIADLQVADEEEDQFISDLKRSVQRVSNDEETFAEAANLDELISSLGNLSFKPTSDEAV